MSGTGAEIFRSPRRPECEERAFMLAAVGIANHTEFDGTDFVLMVAEAQSTLAQDHLALYEQERLSRPPPPPPGPKLHPYALVGCFVYALILLAVTAAISNGLWRLDAFDLGELDARRVQLGQWWRVWTALTLHMDAAHLGANTAAGMWFGFLAARLTGSGHAWLLIVVGAGLANWIEARFGPLDHRAVGASTAVFTALGVLSAYSWRSRFSYPQRWALRWGPLVAGILLLGWTGTGGEDPNAPAPAQHTVDVVAHALGFTVGALLGAAIALRPVARITDRIPQWTTAVLAIAIMAFAWWRALVS